MMLGAGPVPGKDNTPNIITVVGLVLAIAVCVLGFFAFGIFGALVGMFVSFVLLSVAHGAVFGG
jgi:phosphatidylglycerophosphate synthase